MGPEDLVRKQFGDHAAAYRTSAPHATGPSLGRVLELTRPRHQWKALDVSTGAGHMALALAPLVKWVVATDLVPGMLDQAADLARERGTDNLHLALAHSESLPFGNESFDLVTNRIALHHYHEARTALNEAGRVLKWGGLFALVDNVVPPDKVTAGYINHFEKLRDPSHNWCFPLVRLGAMLKDAGFTILHEESQSKELDLQDWARRMGNDDAQIEDLARRLEQAPEAAREFFRPHRVEGIVRFSLTEATIISKKG